MLGGIALANALAVTFEAGILLWIAQRSLAGATPQVSRTAAPAAGNREPAGKRAGSFAALAVRGLAAGAAMAAIILIIERAGLSSPLWALAGGAVSAGIYFLLMGLLGVEEVRGWQKRLRRPKKFAAET
jgi:hypothetical protein